MKLNGFDRVSPIYDFLAKLIFGKSIVNAQIHFLNKIPDQSKVLILGGGSGWILTELLKIKPDCEIWFIDASAKMIALAGKKIGREQYVRFIYGTEEDIPPLIKFDAAITNFYLDMFDGNSLQRVVGSIHSSMKESSVWIATDFVEGKQHWKRMMLKMMYLFFRLTCGIEAKELPDWRSAIEHTKKRPGETKSFYGSFIESCLYR